MHVHNLNLSQTFFKAHAVNMMLCEFQTIFITLVKRHNGDIMIMIVRVIAYCDYYSEMGKMKQRYPEQRISAVIHLEFNNRRKD